MTKPDGSALDLTGASVTARLEYDGSTLELDVSSLDETGRFVVTAPGQLVVAPHSGRRTVLAVSVTDSLGAVTDYVWPVVWEEP